MITKTEIAALWTLACPSFQQTLGASCSEHGDDLLYIHAGTFARHLLHLHTTGQRSEFAAIGAFIERLHIEGDDYTREFGTVGILEAVQNVWGHTDVAPGEFLPYLHPVSTAAWHCLNDFWAGRSPVVRSVPTSS